MAMAYFFISFLEASTNMNNFQNTKMLTYEVKNNCCSTGRIFKIKRDGVFVFKISPLVLEIFTILYYANVETDDVIDC